MQVGKCSAMPMHHVTPSRSPYNALHSPSYYGISVVRIPYVCLDCNLTQPARAVPFQNKHSFTMGENSEERDAWEKYLERECLFRTSTVLQWAKNDEERDAWENSWSVKVYFKRAATCEDRPGYL